MTMMSNSWYVFYASARLQFLALQHSDWRRQRNPSKVHMLALLITANSRGLSFQIQLEDGKAQ